MSEWQALGIVPDHSVWRALRADALAESRQLRGHMDPEKILAARRIVRPFRGEGLTPATHAAKTAHMSRALTDPMVLRALRLDESLTAHGIEIREADARRLNTKRRKSA